VRAGVDSYAPEPWSRLPVDGSAGLGFWHGQGAVASLYEQINIAYEDALGGVPGDLKTRGVAMGGHSRSVPGRLRPP
jgi:hypothetical protein